MEQKKTSIAVKVSGSGMAGAVGVFAALTIAPVIVTAGLGSVGVVGTGSVSVAANVSADSGLTSSVGVGRVRVSPVPSAGAVTGVSGRGTVRIVVIPVNKSGAVTGYGSVKTGPALSGTWVEPANGTGSVRTTVVLAALFRLPEAPLSGAVVLNSTTGGHAVYTNYPYCGMFRLGRDYYGISQTGVHKLAGDLDGTADIQWKAVSGVTDFGVPQRKYMEYLYAYLRTTNDVSVRTIVDEQKDKGGYTIVADSNPGSHRKPLKLAKGLRGTAWQLQLEGTGPTDVQQIELNPIVAPRV